MNATDLAKLDHDSLVALILKQAAINDALNARIDALNARIEELTRSGKRQAAPFSKLD